MARLKDRQHQIPNGLIFLQPETGWKPPPFASFQTIVDSLIAHRMGNPFLVQKHGWSTDPVQVADEVDAFNARVCQVMGWNDYIDAGAGGAPSVPFPLPSPPRLFGKLSQLAAGGKKLVKWVASKEEAVPLELSASRSKTCAELNGPGKPCPLNGKGGWERWFTIPVTEAIRGALQEAREMNLSTPYDDELGVCEACSCPLRLKVHMKIDAVLDGMPPQDYAALVPECWIRKEKQ